MLSPLSTWLRQQRLARGWTVAEMGRQLQQAAKISGDHTVPTAAILTSYVRRWEAGRIGLTERYRIHYCTALGIPPDQLGQRLSGGPRSAAAAIGSATHISPPDTAGGMPGAPPGTQLPTGTPGMPGEQDDHRGSEVVAVAVNRPGAMSSAGSPDLLIAMIAEESLDFGEWADTSNIGDSTLEHYATQVRRLADDYQRAAPLPLLLETKRLRDGVFAKLRGHQRPGHTSDLYLIAAQACGLLAWMSGDMGFYRAADAHAWTGWVCADHADHDGARAWIRATQSKLAYWDGRFSESAQLAEDGLRYHSPDSGQVMAALFRARALARLGRDQDAVQALSQASSGLERAGDDEVGGLWGVTPARFHALASSVHAWRREPRQVLTETSLALQQFEMAPHHERNYGAEIHTRIDQAQAHLLLTDLDGAAAALRPVLSLAPDSRYEPITQHLAQFRLALTQPAFSSAHLAQQLHEEIETYCRESITRELAS